MAFPIDPLEVLSRKWELSELDLYEERWRVEDASVVSYMRRKLGAPVSGIMGSENVWKDDLDGWHPLHTPRSRMH